MRTIITIPDDDLEILDNICASNKLSRSHAIREAIKEYIYKKSELRGKAFGAFKDIFDKENSVEYQNNLRKEWEE